MCERLDELGAAAARGVAPATEVVLITFADAALAAEYRRTNDVPIRVLSDPDRAVYRAYGFERGTRRRVWGLRTVSTYLRLVTRGRRHRLRIPRGDTLQLGGDVVIDPRGRLAYVHRGAGPDDRPPVDELVAAVRGARSRG